MILICAGSGLSPFRGFLQERSLLSAAGRDVARSLLLFGCDHPEADFLYRDELMAMQASGLLDVRTAFYEQPQDAIRFVQHRLWNDRAEVLELFRTGAPVFVCGDAKGMAPAVRKTWLEIFAEALRATPHRDPAQHAADQQLAEAEREHRYVEDVFG